MIKPALLFTLAALAMHAQAPRPDVPIRVGTGPVAFWTTLGAAQKLLPGPPVRVVVEPYKGGVPWEAESANGDIHMQTEEGGVKSEMVKSAVCAGWQKLPSGEKVLFYQGIGPKAITLGAALQKDVYRMTAPGEFTPVAEADNAYRALPNGEKVLMTRAAGSNGPWTAAAMDGKVFQMSAGGSIVESGTSAYHWVVANGKRVALVYLSKGSRKTDKWVGERDGVIYIEK